MLTYQLPAVHDWNTLHCRKTNW